MGQACSSNPAVADDESDGILEPIEANGSKAWTTRARRLSVSADAKGHVKPGAAKTPIEKGAALQAAHVPQAGAPADPTIGAECEGSRQQQGSKEAQGARLPTDQGEVARRNSGTRRRRLSYITNDNDIARLKAEGGGEAGGDGEGDHCAAVGPLRTFGMSVACVSRAGREPGYKKTNQDSCFAFERFIGDDESLFGAMDGHGPHGHLVSSFVKQHLPLLLADRLASGDCAMRALSEGFLECDARLGVSRIDCEFSGSTCVVAHLKGAQLTTAWVGDSRCVLGRLSPSGAWEAVELTADHKPTNPGEKERILRSQGRVERLVDELGQPMGPHRVWLQYAWVPGLAMSRALGDQLAHQVGVSSEPEHQQVALAPEDRFMVLASDGVWEFISSQEAVELVAALDDPEEAGEALVEEAFQRWLVEEEGVVDDITVVVVRFHHGSHGANGAGPAISMRASATLDFVSGTGRIPPHTGCPLAASVVAARAKGSPAMEEFP